MKESNQYSLWEKNLLPIDHPQLRQLKELEQALRFSWSKETCAPSLREKWTRKNPSLGHCAITALIVNDFFGGEIVKDQINNHYWNKDQWGEIDLDREQFPIGTDLKFTQIRTRDSILRGEWAEKAQTARRYPTLKRKVIENLNK